MAEILGRTKISAILEKWPRARARARARVCIDVGCCAIGGTKDHRTMRYLVGRLADVSNTGYASLKCGQVGIIYVRLGVFCHEFHVCRYN